MYRKYTGERLHLSCFSDDIEDEIDFDVAYKTFPKPEDSPYYPAIVIFNHVGADLKPKFKVIYQCECKFGEMTPHEREMNIATPDGRVTIWDWIMSCYRMSFKELIVHDEDYFKLMGLTRDMIGAQHEPH